MEHTTIAVDLAKSVFQVAISHRVGQVTSEHRLRRNQMKPFFAQQPAATVLLEACGSAHHWARELQRLGRGPDADLARGRIPDGVDMARRQYMLSEDTHTLAGPKVGAIRHTPAQAVQTCCRRDTRSRACNQYSSAGE